MSTMASRRSSAVSSMRPARCTEGKFEAIQAMSARRGMPFEWAFLLDALQAERDQGITIDTTQIRFRTAAREVVLIDAPGHKEFLKNMVTGAARRRCGVDRGGCRGGRRRADAATCLSAASAWHAPRGRRRQQDGSRRLSAARFQAVSRDLVDHLAALGVSILRHRRSSRSRRAKATTSRRRPRRWRGTTDRR